MPSYDYLIAEKQRNKISLSIKNGEILLIMSKSSSISALFPNLIEKINWEEMLQAS